MTTFSRKPRSSANPRQTASNSNTSNRKATPSSGESRVAQSRTRSSRTEQSRASHTRDTTRTVYHHVPPIAAPSAAPKSTSLRSAFLKQGKTDQKWHSRTANDTDVLPANGADSQDDLGEAAEMAAPAFVGKSWQSADDEIADFAKVNYLEVTRHQHDQRIDNFLLARLKGLPRSHVYQMIRSDEIRINNKRCKAHDKLERGDIVRIAPIRLATREKPIISATLAEGLLARIIYEDEGLIVLNKPSGMAVHGGSGESFGVIEAMREATGKKYLELVHRIDKDTSGLLMIAKKRSTLKALQTHLQDKTIKKTYLCVAAGWLAADSLTIDKPLLRYTLANGERRVKVAPSDAQAKPSQTVVKVLERQMVDDQRISVLSAQPLTGRTHQIRVHLQSIGHPLLGDDKYNIQQSSEGLTVRRLCLHAWQLHIPDYPPFIAPVPEDMSVFLTGSF